MPSFLEAKFEDEGCRPAVSTNKIVASFGPWSRLKRPLEPSHRGDNVNFSPECVQATTGTGPDPRTGVLKIHRLVDGLRSSWCLSLEANLY